MTKTEIILDCTIKALDILLRKYQSSDIIFDELKSHSEIKIEFLTKNIQMLSDLQTRNHAEDILNVYRQTIIRQ